MVRGILHFPGLYPLEEGSLGGASPTALHLGEVGVLGLAEGQDDGPGMDSRSSRAVRDPREVERERIAAESRARAAETAKADATIRKAWERYSKFIDHQRQADKVRQVFNADILPFLGDTAVHGLTRQQVKDRIRAIAKRSVHQAFATFWKNLRTFLSWCRDEGDYGLEVVATDAMHAHKIIGQKKKPRKRVLTDDEIFAFWRATRPERWRAVKAKAMGLSRPESKVICYGCRVLLLSAARFNEISQADRGELNSEGTVLTIPPATQKRRGAPILIIPLAAQEIIALLPRWNAGTFFFSRDGERPARVWSKDKRRIDRRMLLTLKALARVRGENPKAIKLEPFILHDLRRTVRSRLSQLRVPHEVKELVLGHGLSGLNKVYDQWTYTTEMREALEKWSALLLEIVEKADFEEKCDRNSKGAIGSRRVIKISIRGFSFGSGWTIKKAERDFSRPREKQNRASTEP